MKTIIVLGMHRSMTSLIGKALNDQENVYWHPGKVFGATPTNKLGHFEATAYKGLNDSILSAADGYWAEPPPHEKILAVREQFNHRIQEIVYESITDAQKMGQEIWGWKDPRTTLTIDLWHPHLVNPTYVACIREPKEVVESLVRSYQLDREKATNAVNTYNERLLDFLKRFAISPSLQESS